MSVKNIDSFPSREVPAGEKTRFQILIGPDQGPNFAMRRFTIEAGGSMPLHTNTVEHEQLVLSGRAEVIFGDEVKIVKKDDVVFIPAGMPHSYRTIGDEDFQFLCLVPNSEDHLEILDRP